MIPSTPLRLCLPALAALALMGCAGRQLTIADHALDTDTITQVSTIEALFAGKYAGQITIGEVLQWGDLGLGTVDGLNGELVIVDGVAWRISYEGVAEQVPDEMTVPYVAVAPFAADRTVAGAGSGLDGLRALLDEQIDERFFHLIRIDGTFTGLRTRSVGRQPEDRPLTEVIAEQSLFDFDTVEGTMVCVFTPTWASTLNVAGYHFHFITVDRRTGGHVLDLEGFDASLGIDSKQSLRVVLGDNFAPGGGGSAMPSDRMNELFQPQ